MFFNGLASFFSFLHVAQSVDQLTHIYIISALKVLSLIFITCN